MKKIYSYILATVAISLVTVSCKKDLPFPIDEVTKSVVIDIKRVPGTDGVLSDGMTTGNYQVKLIIPPQQGDYSMMEYAQMLAVLTDAKGVTTAKVVVDNLKEFPSTQTINIADVYGKFGKKAPALGETLDFTMNIVLKSGEVIPGWNQYTKLYNNQAFSGWQVEGRNYSNRVEYKVVCPFDPASTFVGSFKCSESSSLGTDSYEVTLSHVTDKPSPIPAGVDPSKLYGIKIDPITPNTWEPSVTYAVIWVNTEDFSVVTANQDTGDTYQGKPIMWQYSNASVSTCTRQIQFSVKPIIPALGLAYNYVFALTIKP